MLIGTAPAVQTALLRLNAPPSRELGWVAEQAWQLASDQELWIAMQPKPYILQVANQLAGIRQFSFAGRFHDSHLDGGIVSDSPARLAKIVLEVDAIKARLLEDNPKVRPTLDTLTLEHTTTGLRLSARGGKLNSNQFAAELGKQMRTLFSSISPPSKTIAPKPSGKA